MTASDFYPFSKQLLPIEYHFKDNQVVRRWSTNCGASTCDFISNGDGGGRDGFSADSNVVIVFN